MFEYIKLLMTDDTFIYIEVPDMDRINVNYNSLLELSYEHVNFFNIHYLNNMCFINNFYNIDNGILDFKYRIHIDIKACYGIYKHNNNNFSKNNDINILKNKLKNYIKESIDVYDSLYKKININLTYSVVGAGLYSLYFLSLYKNIKVNKHYDESKEGIINNIKILKFKHIEPNEKILILSSLYYYEIYNKLLKLGINEKNIVKLDN